MNLINRRDIPELVQVIFALHPDWNVAQCVLVDLYDMVDRLMSLQDHRDTMRTVRESARYYTLDPTRRSLLQVAAYLASETWECDQERAVPTHHPMYHPTAIDLLIRYIKTLSWWGMERRVSYAATALGCSLYTYRPHEIGDVVPWAAPNIRRAHRNTLGRLQVRFPHLPLVTANRHKQVALRAPTPEERVVVTQALACFAPWTRHLARLPGVSLWTRHFAAQATSEHEEREQVHAILDPQCVGFHQLVEDYNCAFGVTSTMRLDPPETKLGVPTHLPASADAEPTAITRFQPPSLSEEDLARIEYTLARRRERRQRLRPEQLSVAVNSHEIFRGTPQDLAHRVFTVPTYACYLQVYGYDAEGPLLLAVFPFPNEDQALTSEEQTLVVTLAVEQTITLMLQPLRSATGDLEQYRLQLTYDVIHAPGRVPFRDRVLHWLSPLWVPSLAGEQVTAAETPPQDHVFSLEDGTIRVTCTWWGSTPAQPAQLHIAWQADITRPRELWVRFTQRDDTTTVFAEVPLGTALTGEAMLSAHTLGFDPTREPWAFTLLLWEVEP